MSVPITPQALLTASTAYLPIPPSVRQAVRIFATCDAINGNQNTLSELALIQRASTFAATLARDQLDAIETALAVYIANLPGGFLPGSGGAVEVFSGNYGGSTPGVTPTTSAAIAYDFDSPFRIWTWDDPTWNLAGGGGTSDPQVFSGNYGGLAPGITPTTSAAVAYDLQSPFKVWSWSGSAWNFSGSGAGSDQEVFSGNYGGGTPTQTPSTGSAIAYDLDSPFDSWVWNGSAWT